MFGANHIVGQMYGSRTNENYFNRTLKQKNTDSSLLLLFVVPTTESYGNDRISKTYFIRGPNVSFFLMLLPSLENSVFSVIVIAFIQGFETFIPVMAPIF